MMRTYEVQEITRFRSRELGPEPLSTVQLIANLGMEGDKHAKGGNQQLTLIGSRGKEWMNQQEQGFCFRKCKENLCLEGSLSDLRCGTQIQVGDAKLEITIDQKDCYPELCSLHKYKKQDEDVICLLREEFRYAKVVQSGRIEKKSCMEMESKNGFNTCE